MPPVTYSEILHALIEARKERGLSQAQLVRRLGVTKAALSAWETGRNRADMETLAAWASALGMHVAVALSSRGPNPQAEEHLLQGAVELGLDADRSALLLRMARLAGRMSAADGRRLAAYLGAVEADLGSATSRTA